MTRLCILLLSVAICLGCFSPPSGKVFTHLGNGAMVPRESIDDYASEHGVSRDEARARMKEEADQRRIQRHAEQFGVTLEEAKQQIEYSDVKRAESASMEQHLPSANR